MNREPENFDQQLDHALAGYTPADPRPGLEQRILARIEAETIAPEVRFPRLRIALSFASLSLAAVTACVLLMVLLPRPHDPASGQTSRQLNRQPSSVHESSASATSLEAREPQPAHAVARVNPRPSPPAPNEMAQSAAKFPSLQPTAQDVLLAEFVANHPVEALALSKIQGDFDKPLNQAPIRIEPIRMDEIVIPPMEIATNQPKTP